MHTHTMTEGHNQVTVMWKPNVTPSLRIYYAKTIDHTTDIKTVEISGLYCLPEF